MMKKILKHTILGTFLIAAGAPQTSCSLDEVNPGGFTMETVALTEDGFQALVNNIYFAYERYFCGSDRFEPSTNWATLTEGNTDLWTYKGNVSTTMTQWFWYYANSVNNNYLQDWWNGTYDGIGSCNLVLSVAHLAPQPEAELNILLAQTRFMRAVYYFNAISQWGGITMITEPPTGAIDFEPQREDPMTIYEEIIIPDLLFAFEYLEKGTDELNTTPTKKSALGMLVKAYLQTCEFDSSKKYASEALKYAEILIKDAESGGSQYNAYLYPTFEEVFAEENNWTNREALWKHRWAVSSTGHGSSNGNYRTNRLVENFYCDYIRFGARVDIQESRIQWGGNKPGIFMPSQHLMNLYVQEDGTLDPRFHEIFQTEWLANNEYTWSTDDINRYDKASSVDKKTLTVGDLAIKIIMPQDEDYAMESANKHQSDYLVIDYKDVYNDAAKNVKMNYTYQNPSAGFPGNGTADNLFRYFYPSLTKFNSSRYHVVNANSMRNGNQNSVLIMRMADIYLLAAEADIYVNGGTNAMKYINKIRERAGADPLTGTATIRTVLDERGRELCGEMTRFFDLKRTGMLKDATYLNSTHPDLGQYFKEDYALRPIPTDFTDLLINGSYYQNPGY